MYDEKVQVFAQDYVENNDIEVEIIKKTKAMLLY